MVLEKTVITKQNDINLPSSNISLKGPVITVPAPKVISKQKNLHLHSKNINIPEFNFFFEPTKIDVQPSSVFLSDPQINFFDDIK